MVRYEPELGGGITNQYMRCIILNLPVAYSDCVHMHRNFVGAA